MAKRVLPQYNQLFWSLSEVKHLSMWIQYCTFHKRLRTTWPGQRVFVFNPHGSRANQKIQLRFTILVMILRVRFFRSFCWKNPVFWNKPGFFPYTLDKNRVFLVKNRKKSGFFFWKTWFFYSPIGFLKTRFFLVFHSIWSTKTRVFLLNKNFFLNVDLWYVLRLGMDR